MFGPTGGASDSTLLRALNELGGHLDADGLPDARLSAALAKARALAWSVIIQRRGSLPAVKVAGRELTRRQSITASGDSDTANSDTGADGSRPITVIRIDGMLIEADSAKENAAGNYKGGFGFHALGAWCSNVGDHLAVMNRPGNAGSFTATDQVKVLDAALEQIPASWRQDLLVTIDGAGASHEIIDHLTTLNTAPEPGRHGRRVEYSIGWPVDARTIAGIEAVPPNGWGEGLRADGKVHEQVGGAELTGLLRQGPSGDRLKTWPADMRVFARRVPRGAHEQAELGQDATWRYSAFATNTVGGQAQFLDARHRTQAHVEDNNKDWKTCGADNLPSKDYLRNSAWLQLAALAVSVLAWLRLIGLDTDLAKATPKTLRYRLFAAPARLVTHARQKILKIAESWPWAPEFTNA